jgi:hypothetical protein
MHGFPSDLPPGNENQKEPGFQKQNPPHVGRRFGSRCEKITAKEPANKHGHSEEVREAKRKIALSQKCTQRRAVSTHVGDKQASQNEKTDGIHTPAHPGQQKDKM